MARVLIVEDEQTDRMMLGSIVEGMGHEVYFASDGEQAFKTYMKMSIDVVVTDLLLPHVDGLEFIVALRTLFPDAPVIAVSGKGPELLAEAENKGACVALSKPVDPHELLEAIAKAAADSSSPPLPKSKLVAQGNYRPLDEFEFEHTGRVRCIPVGGAIAADQAGDGLARTTEPLWDIRVDGASIGQVDAHLDETKETVREAATKLIDENLQRANLTPAQEAEHLKRRKELWGARIKELLPSTGHGWLLVAFALMPAVVAVFQGLSQRGWFLPYLIVDTGVSTGWLYLISTAVLLGVLAFDHPLNAAKPSLLATGVALALFVLAGAASGDDAQSAAQNFGGFLELAGLALVVVGLAGRAGTFGDFLRGLIRRGKPTVHPLEVKVGGYGVAGAPAGLVVELGPDATVERRLAITTAQVDELSGKIQSLEERMDQEMQAQRGALEEEDAKGVKMESELRQLVRSLETDGLSREWVGVIWVSLGIVVETWPGPVIRLIELLG